MRQIKAFFDKNTFTLTYIVYDDVTRDAVIIDPLLDYDHASGKVSKASANEVVQFISSAGLKVNLILETHAHADHLSSSQIMLQTFTQAQLAIGEQIRLVQVTFKPIYNLPADFATDGSQFDRLLRDGERVVVGSIEFDVIYTPGHTQACASYNFDGHLFVGDALFMPDYGTGRTDFPGGSAGDLFDSITGKIYTLPNETKIYTCHDYLPNGRELRYECSVSEQKEKNIQLNASIKRDDFIRFRANRDAGLPAPKLIHPSVQMNINAAHFPDKESNGTAFFKTPLTINF